MALQSVWYYTNLPEDIVEIIEKDISKNFDDQMADSRLHGDALNKDKRNSQNAWIPTDHWLGGFMWHYVQRANREAAQEINALEGSYTFKANINGITESENSDQIN